MGVYMYNGPVLYYDKVLANNWTGLTMADSKAKAISNLKYQFKNKANLSSGVGGITFSGSVVEKKGGKNE